ncbi:equilibrative nucleobase transporter 1-like [Ylistrum balloti]|uniref:equilibrative nucleobase transporter 1-like n=1 Tax=Ylistrum balloti TaxID=509963 RepID=UPI002905D1C6|nr:equilibrative nucleobase transporter 1-like [Ylistrum balloti]
MDMSNVRVAALVVLSLLEILFFGGMQYGWFAFAFILKQEGVFRNLCVLKDNAMESNASFGNGTLGVVDCFPQDEQFNLIFSIGVAVFSSLTFVSGQLFLSFDIKRIRTLCISLGLAGILCFALISQDNPWLSLPGIMLTGLAGQALMIADYVQVLPLLRKRSPIYIGLINGCMDSSVLTMMIVKRLHEDGVDKKFSLIGFATLFVLIAGTCTLLYPMPQQREVTEDEEEKHERDFLKEAKDEAKEDMNLVQQTTRNGTKEKRLAGDADLPSGDMLNKSIVEILCHRLFISHVVWTSIVLLKIFYFLGSANRLMGQILEDYTEVSYFTDVMTLTMLGSLVSSFIAGYTIHVGEKMFTGVLRTVIPLVTASGLAILLSVLEFVSTPTALYADFVVLTFLRSFVYCANIQYIRTTFPFKYVSIVYGVTFSISGMLTLSQYGLFAWTEEYNGAMTHVRLFLLFVSSVSLLHPVLVFYNQRRRR